MANKIIIKNGAGAPPSDALAVAELGFDTQNKKLYIGDTLETNLLINPLSVNLEGTSGEITNPSKPQSPLQYEDKYFYPLTTVGQIITDNNTRLDVALNGLVYAEEQNGNIKNLFTDYAKTKILFPRTTINAVSDNNGVGLNVLLDNKQEKHKPLSLSLLASNWSNMTQTASVDGVTQDNSIIPVPAPENHTAYCEFGVYCSAQANGKLTFVCAETPTVDLTVNVLILN